MSTTVNGLEVRFDACRLLLIGDLVGHLDLLDYFNLAGITCDNKIEFGIPLIRAIPGAVLLRRIADNLLNRALYRPKWERLLETRHSKDELIAWRTVCNSLIIGKSGKGAILPEPT